MANITRSDFPVLMSPAVVALTVMFDDAVKNQPPAMRDFLFRTEDTKKAYETGFGLVGMEQPVIKRELEGMRFTRPKSGRPVVISNTQYALATAISEEALEDDQSGKLGKIIMPELAGNYTLLQEQQASDVFNFGFSVQGYEPERNPARPLFSNDHRIISPSSYGASVSNLLSGALSLSSLNAARTQGSKNLTESGKKSPIVYRYLMVPPALQTLAEELLTSIQKPGQFAGGTQPNDRNVFNNSTGTYKLEIIVNHWLTSDTAWILLTEKDARQFYWYTRKALKRTTSYDDDKLAVIYRTSARWGYGFYDWRGVAGSPGV